MTSRLYWTTFANRRLRPTLRRITAEAETVGVFAGLFPADERVFDAGFRRRFRWFIWTHPRGYGYWVWKPYVIERALERIPDGAYLLYTDAGCTLLPGGQARLGEYVTMLEESGRDLLAFRLEFPEEEWTKADLLIRLEFTGDTDRRSPQCMSGAMVVRNSPRGRAFVARWRSIMEESPHWIDDSRSVAPDAPGFVEHRHDQSVFSILAKQMPALVLPNEVDWEGRPAPAGVPINATRSLIADYPNPMFFLLRQWARIKFRRLRRRSQVSNRNEG